MPSDIDLAIDSGKGLEQAFKKCVKTNGEKVCQIQLVSSLNRTEIIAQTNYALSARLMPRFAPKFLEIKGEEDHHSVELTEITGKLKHA